MFQKRLKSHQTSNLKPQTSNLKPQTSTLNPQPSTLNPQPSTLNPQPSTLNPQPSTLNPQPSKLLRYLDFKKYSSNFCNSRGYSVVGILVASVIGSIMIMGVGKMISNIGDGVTEFRKESNRMGLVSQIDEMFSRLSCEPIFSKSIDVNDLKSGVSPIEFSKLKDGNNTKILDIKRDKEKRMYDLEGHSAFKLSCQEGAGCDCSSSPTCSKSWVLSLFTMSYKNNLPVYKEVLNKEFVINYDSSGSFTCDFGGGTPVLAAADCTGGRTWNGSACECPSGEVWLPAPAKRCISCAPFLNTRIVDLYSSDYAEYYGGNTYGLSAEEWRNFLFHGNLNRCCTGGRIWKLWLPGSILGRYGCICRNGGWWSGSPRSCRCDRDAKWDEDLNHCVCGSYNGFTILAKGEVSNDRDECNRL